MKWEIKPMELRAKLEELYVDHMRRLKQTIPDEKAIGKMTGRELTAGLMAGINNSNEIGQPFLPEGPNWPDLAVPILAKYLRVDLSAAYFDGNFEVFEKLQTLVRNSRNLHPIKY